MRHQNPDVEAKQPLLNKDVGSRAMEKSGYGVSSEQRNWVGEFPRRRLSSCRMDPCVNYRAASWIWAKPYSSGRVLPQTIAHRGYKAEHPENTMKAFEGAAEVGAHAIETDIHLSKDDVVVLSHVRLPLQSRGLANR